MPAISFSGETSRGPFWQQILDRAKTQTCRTPRKHVIKQGDKLILYWKQRVPTNCKPIHRIGIATCVNIERRKYKEFAYDDAFAWRDGFENSVELREWFGDPEDFGEEEYDVISFVCLHETVPYRLEKESL